MRQVNQAYQIKKEKDGIHVHGDTFITEIQRTTETEILTLSKVLVLFLPFVLGHIVQEYHEPNTFSIGQEIRCNKENVQLDQIRPQDENFNPLTLREWQIKWWNVG